MTCPFGQEEDWPLPQMRSREHPMPLSPEGRRLRARAAAVTRHYPDQPELAADARQQLKADAAERYVRDLVDSWPPLSDAQRGRLAALLTGDQPQSTDGGSADHTAGRS